jgi:multidrug efflux pump subunit AcrB
MIRFLLRRPIAVFMAFTACFIIGVVTYKTLPVSLLPDIAIPEITVQVTGENTSARELENTVMRTLRSQLMQVGRLEDLRSETRDGSGIVRMRFEHGTNTDLAFIEVNEKIDVAMSYLPKSTTRPRVIKASATDIPVLYLNLTLKDEKADAPDAEERFLELCDYAENVVRRRLEQLQEVAMVDMSGLAHKQVQIVPKHSKMEALGITVQDIENALASNNVEPGSMTVREGYYEYNIRFSTIVRTVEDIENIPLRHDGRIMQMKELADIRIVPTTETGLTQYNGKCSVSLAIIKQADENMERMKAALNGTVRSLKYANPDINFDVSRNQTELLDYTLTNLQQNLTLGFLFILIVAVLFMGGVRSPVVIGVCMVVAIVISFIFFYLFGMSLNIISLSGLILAEGMMIDNAIIVTENITQYRDMSYSVDEACARGTSEVITPMLSSSLTTIAVFFPLVFISGIAGAIFYDEAFSVTVGLIASYITGIILLPVLYKIVFSAKLPAWIKKRIKTDKLTLKFNKVNSINLNTPLQRFYDKGVEWVFSHKALTVLFTLLSIPLCVLMFNILPKERMPQTSQTELSVYIDWNENIHLDDNRERMEELEAFCTAYAEESSTHIGIQQYLLEKSLVSTTEAELYLRTASTEQLEQLQQSLQKELSEKYPLATVSFHEPENVFERIFDTNEPELVVELYNKDKEKQNNIALLRQMESKINDIAGEKAIAPATGQQINLTIDRERLLMYGVTYNEITSLLKNALRDNKIATLRSYQDYLPITIAGGEQTLNGILNRTFVTIRATDGTQNRHQVPLRAFVKQSLGEDLKTITAGTAGEYIPYTFAETEKAKEITNNIKEAMRGNSDDWEASFSGAFFSSNKMINELVVVLFISLLLMYFILTSQFGSFVQPLIVLAEIPIDVGFALVIMCMLGISLNLMSAIGIVVSCGIIINDSILKLDMINVLRNEGTPLMEAIHTAGSRRLRSIVMTSLTTILAMVPLLFTHDFGSELQKPLAIAMIATMTVGTLVSLFVIPLIYWFIYRNRQIKVQ